MYSIAELLMEAQPLPFEVNTDGDKWNFETDAQQFQLRMSLLQNGTRKPFKKQNAGGIVFSLWEINNNKASQKVKRISKPLNVVATIAEIIAEQLKENKQATTVFLRVPSKMNVNAATRISSRYIKMKAQQWEVLGAVDDGTDMSYIAVARKGTDAGLQQIFGEKTELTIRQFVEVDNEEEAQRLMSKGNAIIRRMISMDPELGDTGGATDDVPTKSHKEQWLEDELAKVAAKGLSPEIFRRGLEIKYDIEFGNKAPEPVKPEPVKPVKPEPVKPAPVDTSTKLNIKNVSGMADIKPVVLEYMKENPSLAIHDPDFANRPVVDVEKDMFKVKRGTLKDKYNKMTANGSTLRHKFESALSKVFPTPDYDEKELDTLIDIMANRFSLDDFLDQSQLYFEVEAQIKKLLASSKKADKLEHAIFGHFLQTSYITPFDTELRSLYSDYTPKFKDKESALAITKYTGRGYQNATAFMIDGNDSPSNTFVIKQMDRLFNNEAVRLSEGTTLYRSMELSGKLATSILTDKLFHFRNYTSTSLSIKLGFSFVGNTLKVFGGYKPFDPAVDKIKGSQQTCMTIRDAHLLPVIVPGSTSKYPTEAEVILPRGFTVRVNKFVVKKDVAVRDMYLDTSVIPADQLTLESVVYDGDHFFATGELVRFSQFITEAAPAPIAAIPDRVDREAMLYMDIANSDDVEQHTKDKFSCPVM